MSLGAMRSAAKAAATEMSIPARTPANALSMQECSAKYKAAKEAGTLKGMKWNDFRKAQCGADATAAPEPAPAPPPLAQALNPNRIPNPSV